MMHQFRWFILVDIGRKTVWLLGCCEFGGLWAIAPKGFIIFSCVCSGYIVQCGCTKNMTMKNRVHSTAKLVLNTIIPPALHVVIVNITKLKSCSLSLSTTGASSSCSGTGIQGSRNTDFTSDAGLQSDPQANRNFMVSSWTGSWERMRVYPPLLCWKEQPSFQHSQG